LKSSEWDWMHAPPLLPPRGTPNTGTTGSCRGQELALVPYLSEKLGIISWRYVSYILMWPSSSAYSRAGVWEAHVEGLVGL
jgi:hypothetical protein